jgi:hypothetical protein
MLYDASGIVNKKALACYGMTAPRQALFSGHGFNTRSLFWEVVSGLLRKRIYAIIRGNTGSSPSIDLGMNRFQQ